MSVDRDQKSEWSQRLRDGGDPEAAREMADLRWQPRPPPSSAADVVVTLGAVAACLYVLHRVITTSAPTPADPEAEAPPHPERHSSRPRVRTRKPDRYDRS